MLGRRRRGLRWCRRARSEASKRQDEVRDPFRWGYVALVCEDLVGRRRVLRLDRDFIYLGSPDRSRWRDLRLWAVVVTVPYLLIYLLL